MSTGGISPPSTWACSAGSEPAINPPASSSSAHVPKALSGSGSVMGLQTPQKPTPPHPVAVHGWRKPGEDSSFVYLSASTQLQTFCKSRHLVYSRQQNPLNDCVVVVITADPVFPTTSSGMVACGCRPCFTPQRKSSVIPPPKKRKAEANLLFLACATAGLVCLHYLTLYCCVTGA